MQLTPKERELLHYIAVNAEINITTRDELDATDIEALKLIDKIKGL